MGKTTVAKKIAEKINGKYISIDEVLVNNNLSHVDEKIGCIPEENFLKANQIVGPIINSCLENNDPVIIDGNFYHKNQIADLVNNFPFQVFAFTLTAPLEVCVERDSKRPKCYGIGAATAVYNLVSKFDYGEVVETELLSVDETINEIIFKMKSDFGLLLE